MSSLIGEPGGGLEYPAAELAAKMRTPVVAYITGQGSPQDARMGHAGAVVGDDERSRPQSKMRGIFFGGNARRPPRHRHWRTVARLSNARSPRRA